MLWVKEKTEKKEEKPEVIQNLFPDAIHDLLPNAGESWEGREEGGVTLWHVWFMQFNAIYIYLVFPLFDCIVRRLQHLRRFAAVKLFPSRF